MIGHHTEIISAPQFTVILTGVKDKCDHDTKETVFMLGNGDYLFESRYRCPTNEATQEYINKIAEQRDTYVSGATSGCSKCKKVHSLRDLMGDAYWI